MDAATLGVSALGLTFVILIVAFSRAFWRGLRGTDRTPEISNRMPSAYRSAMDTKFTGHFGIFGSWIVRGSLIVVSVLLFITATTQIFLDLPQELPGLWKHGEYGRVIGTLMFQPLPFMAATWAWVVARRIGARMRAPTYSSELRPAVVYLRSFGDDERSAGTRWKGALLPWPTEEEQLVSVLSDLGSVLAIGKPKEPLPYLGATRVQVPDSEWKTAVREFAAHSQAVIYRVPTVTSPGVVWEIEELLRNDILHKLILILPKSNLAIKNFNLLVGKRFGHELPAIKLPKLVFRPSIYAFVWWNGQRPYIATVTKPSWLRCRLIARIEPSLRQALHTWSKEASVSINPPRLRAHQLILSVGIAAIALAVFLELAG